jgi:hypothetical protein
MGRIELRTLAEVARQPCISLLRPSKAADGGLDGAHHRAGDAVLSLSEDDGADVAHNAGPDLDQFPPQVGE